MQARPDLAWINPLNQCPQEGQLIKIKWRGSILHCRFSNGSYVTHQGHTITQPDGWMVTL